MRGGAEINRNFKILAPVAAAVVIVDQITKALVVARLPLYSSVELIPGLLDLVHYRNTGAAFGLLHGGGLKVAALTAVSIAAVAITAFLARGSRSAFYTFALSLIAGGAVGNLIDRVRFSSVVDFIDAHVGPYHWPAFNVADSAITVGVVAALAHHYFMREKA